MFFSVIAHASIVHSSCMHKHQARQKALHSPPVQRSSTSTGPAAATPPSHLSCSEAELSSSRTASLTLADPSFSTARYFLPFSVLVSSRSLFLG